MMIYFHCAIAINACYSQLCYQLMLCVELILSVFFLSMQINTNGIISFDSSFPQPPSNNSIPPLVIQSGNETIFAPPSIAPFWSDIDTSVSGNISFNEVDPSSDIRSVTDIIRAAFKDSLQFVPTQVYNISWEGVPPYSNDSNASISETNTFYCELASDGNSSYAIFTYVDIQWTRPDTKNTSENAPSPWIGFSAGNGVDFESVGGGSLNDVFTTGNVFYPRNDYTTASSLTPREGQSIWVYEIGDDEIKSGGNLFADM